MSFVATPSTPFVTGHQLTPETANYWRNAIASSIDGSGGGAYAPVNPIQLGGAGADVLSGTSFRINNGATLDAAVGSTVAFAGTNFISGTNTIQGTTSLAGATTIPNTATLTGAAGSTVTLGGTITLSGATTASNFTMSGTNKVKLASRSITRVQASMPAPTSATWTVNSQGFAVQAANNTDKLIWPLRVPHGATLTTVTVTLIAAGGHGALPTRPSFEVGYISSSGFTSVATANDGFTLPTYETSHAFAIAPVTEVIDRSARRYVAIITGESGANYVAGLTVRLVACTYSIAEYDED